MMISVSLSGQTCDSRFHQREETTAPTRGRAYQEGSECEDVALYQAKLVIPDFTRGKKQLHPLEVEHTRKVASVRMSLCIRPNL